MVYKIVELILKGKYEETLNIEQILDKSNDMRIYEKLYDSVNIIFYTYFMYKIGKREESKDHYTFSLILSQMLNFIEGSYDVTYYHAKTVIELESNNLKYKEYILFFNGCPDLNIKIDEEQLKSYAGELLINDSKNTAGLSYMRMYDRI